MTMTNNAVQQAIDMIGSAKELSIMSKVTETTIGKARKGKIVLTAPTARKLSDAVNGAIPPEQFVFPELFKPL